MGDTVREQSGARGDGTPSGRSGGNTSTSNVTPPKDQPKEKTEEDLAAEKQLQEDLAAKPALDISGPTPEEQQRIDEFNSEDQNVRDANSGIDPLTGLPTGADPSTRPDPQLYDPRLNYAYGQTMDVGNNMNSEVTETGTSADGKGKTYGRKATQKKWRGTPSIFNQYALIRLDSKMPYNQTGDDGHLKLQNTADHESNFSGVGNEIKVSNPRALDIIEWSQQKGNEQFPYYWSDFMWCKYYGQIPNNHLVTLRRYPAPVLDSGRVGGSRKKSEAKNFAIPVAQAITFLGEETGNKLSEIFQFTTGINWRVLEAEVNKVEGNEVGGADAMGGGLLGKMNNLLSILNGNANFGSISGAADQRSQYDPYENGPYSNRIYGPVNCIAKTYSRARGLEFKNSIALNFHYVLDSYSGVNPKVAMLDLISNILSLVFMNAAFWGGANRYFPHVPQYPFFSGAAQSAWFGGNPGGFLDAIGSEVGKVMRNITNWFDGIDLKNPDSFLKALGKLAGSVAKIGMAHLQAGHRPNIIGFKALLTGEPVGDWHLTIGNPLDPIAKIGNLIVTETKFQFSDTLGPNDFPEELIVTINLDHGKPRDKGDVESMFNNGGGRMYYSYGTKTSQMPWNTSAARHSKVDTSYGRGHSVPGYTRANNAQRKKDRILRGYIPFEANDNDIAYQDNQEEDQMYILGRRVYRTDAFDPLMKTALELSDKLAHRDKSEVDPASDKPKEDTTATTSSPNTPNNDGSSGTNASGSSGGTNKPPRGGRRVNRAIGTNKK